jgi:DNA-binding MarR family transcriptional regulator
LSEHHAPAVPAASSDTRRQAWSALVSVYQTVLRDVVERLEAQTPLDSATFSALAYLERADPPGRLRLGELHRRMRVRYSQPGISRLVQRMEADGLVERRPDAGDRRATLLVVTRLGRARYRRAEAVYRAALDEQFSRHVGDDEADLLAAVLGDLATRLAPPDGAV